MNQPVSLPRVLPTSLLKWENRALLIPSLAQGCYSTTTPITQVLHRCCMPPSTVCCAPLSSNGDGIQHLAVKLAHSLALPSASDWPLHVQRSTLGVYSIGGVDAEALNKLNLQLLAILGVDPYVTESGMHFTHPAVLARVVPDLIHWARQSGFRSRDQKSRDASGVLSSCQSFTGIYADRPGCVNTHTCAAIDKVSDPCAGESV